AADDDTVSVEAVGFEGEDAEVGEAAVGCIQAVEGDTTRIKWVGKPSAEKSAAPHAAEIVAHRIANGFVDAQDSRVTDTGPAAIALIDFIPCARPAAHRTIDDPGILRSAKNVIVEMIVSGGVELGDSQVAVDVAPRADQTRRRIIQAENAAVVGLQNVSIGIEYHVAGIGVRRG